MHKNLIMACTAVAAFAAFAFAPGASASPVFTSEGKAVPVGTSIIWLHTGDITITGSLNVICSNAELKGTITTNSGTQVKGEIPVGSAKLSGTGTSGDCTSSLGATKVTVNSKLCFETVKSTDNINITGCGSNITYTLEVTGTGPCKYSSAGNTATFKTNAAATFTVLDQVDTEEEGGIFCPSSVKTDYDLDPYTTDLTPITDS